MKTTILQIIVSIVLGMLLLLFVNAIALLYRVASDGYTSLGFKHGQFFLDGTEIGLSLFAPFGIIVILLLAFVLFLLISKRPKQIHG